MLDDIRRLLIRDLEGFQREIERFPDDETVWRTVPGIANAAGTLALHAAGNLQHFIGAVLGGSGYIRDRAAEFSRRGETRAALVRELAAARDAVDRTLAELPEESVETVYPLPLNDLRLRTGVFLMHLSTHLAFHLGQTGYIRRVVTGDGQSVGAVTFAPLAEKA
jgi:uncharacterized damage-inducible protein DinB